MKKTNRKPAHDPESPLMTEPSSPPTLSSPCDKRASSIRSHASSDPTPSPTEVLPAALSEISKRADITRSSIGMHC
ncbi:MAG: hypothetical protein ACFN27_04595 [Prevotella sp.]